MSTKDWAKADIIAAVRKSGTSLRQLSLENGLYEKACSTALHRPYRKPELLIAKAIGVSPQAIWPSRYDERGKRRRFLHSKMLTETSLMDAPASTVTQQGKTSSCLHGEKK